MPNTKEFSFLTDKPSITVEQITGWSYALDAARFTQGKPMTGKEPSEKFKRSAIMAEHSPIKLVQYRIIIHNLRQWIGVHLLRHDYTLPFICSQRSDRNESVDAMARRVSGELLTMIQEEQPDFNPRNLLPQGTCNDHMFWINAQTFINISRRRLCHEASRETQMVWRMVVEELKKVDPVLADFLVPMCIYRGFCPEMQSCGYCLTKDFAENLYIYRNQIPRTEKRLKIPKK